MGKPSKKFKKTDHLAEGVFSLLKSLFKLQSASYFRVPVDVELFKCHTYYDIVKNPIDLTTIKTKLMEGQYNDIDSFKSDIKLIISNCILFNPNSDHYIRKAAEKFDECFEHRWGKLIEMKNKEPEEFSIPLNCEKAILYYKSCEEKSNENVQFQKANDLNREIRKKSLSQISETISKDPSQKQINKESIVPKKELDQNLLDILYKVKFKFYDIEDSILATSEKYLFIYNKKIRKFLTKMSEIYKIWPRYTSVSDDLSIECHSLSIDDRYRGPESNYLVQKSLVFIESYDDVDYEEIRNLKNRLFVNCKRLYKNLKRRRNFIDEEWKKDNYENDLKEFSENLKKSKLITYSRDDGSDSKSYKSIKRRPSIVPLQRLNLNFNERLPSTILKIEKNAQSTIIADPPFLKEISLLNEEISQIENENLSRIKDEFLILENECRNSKNEKIPNSIEIEDKLKFEAFTLNTTTSSDAKMNKCKAFKIEEEEIEDSSSFRNYQIISLPHQLIKKENEDFFKGNIFYRKFNNNFEVHLPINVNSCEVKWEELSLITFFEKLSENQKKYLLKFRELNRESGKDIKTSLRDNLLSNLNSDLKTSLEEEIKIHKLAKVKISFKGEKSENPNPFPFTISNSLSIATIEEFMTLKERRFQCESNFREVRFWKKKHLIELRMTKYKFYDELINSFLQIHKMKAQPENCIYYEIEKKLDAKDKQIPIFHLSFWIPFDDLRDFKISYENQCLSEIIPN